MIDWTRVEELKSEIGADAFIEVADLFLEETDEVVVTLDTPAPDSVVRERLHFLKGSALNLGFQEMADLCSRGERLAAAGQSADVDTAQIVSVYAESKSLFLAHRPG
ncbi:Hpt domain-containing protein [Psychromarinibacter halotolerans]|uniref:Hpt domain-containing protein n=1 Tax=Psychromarinibacter halotolerans TaxID=1775175 RepID=A0ABV7GJV2_9RHOB|nr:Hpt domain-containing protein [Psychromarinibacter halotolerans]MAQ85936.1 histidine kinase [Maritimibacter sp.]MDF0595883.1 Hpt domain-containing protein [Psychromarinibacter halotolerans]